MMSFQGALAERVFCAPSCLCCFDAFLLQTKQFYQSYVQNSFIKFSIKPDFIEQKPAGKHYMPAIKIYFRLHVCTQTKVELMLHVLPCA